MEEAQGKVTPPPQAASPAEMMSGCAQKQQSSTYSSSSHSKGGSPITTVGLGSTCQVPLSFAATPSLTMSALLGKRGFSQAAQYQINPFSLAQSGFRVPPPLSRTFLDQALQNLVTTPLASGELLHLPPPLSQPEKVSVGSFPNLVHCPIPTQILSNGSNVSALTTQLLEQVRLRQGPTLAQTLEELKGMTPLHKPISVYGTTGIMGNQTLNESQPLLRAAETPLPSPLPTPTTNFIIPPYDPSLDYMSLFVKKYAQNQQLLANFSEHLAQRNSLLAEVLNEEQYARAE